MCMKKCIKISCIILAILIVMGGVVFASKVADVLDLHIYIGWKNVKIENLCEMKVPLTWKMEEKNGLVYFYDTLAGNNICLIQS